MSYRPTFAELKAASDVLGWLYKEWDWNGELFDLLTDGRDSEDINNVRQMVQLATRYLEGKMKP